MTVNILGTNYEIKHQTAEQNPKLDDSYGMCECYSKEIIINNKDYDEKETFANIEDFKKKVLRHEIVHAFFFESGIHGEYGTDEELVDWIAYQIPKMVQSMKGAGCL